LLDMLLWDTLYTIYSSERLSGNLSLRRRKIMPPPYGNETQGDHQERVGLA